MDTKVYVGSFASYNRYSKRIVPIAISNGIPSWYTGLRYKPLAPTYELVRTYRNADDCDQKDLKIYISTYIIEVLSKLNALTVYRELMKMSAGKPVILLSQESSSEFSHRKIVKSWFEKSSIHCEELS